MSHKKKPGQRKALKPTPNRLYEELRELEPMMERGEWADVRADLKELQHQFPRRPELLFPLVEACAQLNDSLGVEGAAAELIEIVPPEPDLVFNLGCACLTNGRPGLAVRHFRTLITSWPEDELCRQAQDLIVKADKLVRAEWDKIGFPPDEAEELGLLHETVLQKLDCGHLRQAGKLALELTHRAPYFPTGWNNLSQSQWAAGQRQAAIATARRALEIDAKNVHALGNLCRYLLLEGKTEEAEALGRRLREVNVQSKDQLLKKAEAAAYLGDDEAVLAAYEIARKGGTLPARGQDPLLYHLAAVAEARRGNDKAAKQLWRTALEIAPGHELSIDNLDEMALPIGERDAPWAFPLLFWIEPKILRDLQNLGQKYRADDPKAREKTLTTWLKANPAVERLVPHLLDRGDGSARNFALVLAQTMRTPELLAAVVDFALGQRGQDFMRHRAATIAVEAGLISSPVRLWWEGAWKDLIIRSFEIHDEPTVMHAPAIKQLAGDAYQLLQAGKFQKAEEVLRTALELEPESPDLMNNLANAFWGTGRDSEALQLIELIAERFPHYVIARVALARTALVRHDVKRAHRALEPLQEVTRFHYTEFRAYAMVQIELALAERKKDVALSWLNFWTKLMPDDDEQEEFELMIRSAR